MDKRAERFEEFFLGFRIEEELRPAFDAVADPKDWRGPISALVTGPENLARTIAAIAFFTGGNTEVLPVAGIETKATYETTYRVKSVGYRNGPCGP